MSKATEDAPEISNGVIIPHINTLKKTQCEDEMKKNAYIIGTATLLFIIFGNVIIRGVLNKLKITSEKVKMAILTILFAVSFAIIKYKFIK